MSKFVSFNHVANAACHYARFGHPSPHVYGTRGKGPRWQRSTVGFYDQLTRAMAELFQEHPWGQAEIIVSGGAAVPESPRRGPTDKHVLGRAYDLDAIWWPDVEIDLGGPPAIAERNLITLEAPENWAHYLAVESVLRRHFGTVLGWLYNKAHRDHWHVDDGGAVGWYPKSKSRCQSVQGCLTHVWDCPVAIDGDYGPETQRVWREVLTALEPDVEGVSGLVEDAWSDQAQVERWRAWLLATARMGFAGV